MTEEHVKAVFLIPAGYKLDSEVELDVIENGTIAHRLATAEQASGSTFMVVTDDELNFIGSHMRFFDINPVIMLGVPDADYNNNWHMASNISETEDYTVYIARLRESLSKTHVEHAAPKLRMKASKSLDPVEDEVETDEIG